MRRNDDPETVDILSILEQHCSPEEYQRVSNAFLFFTSMVFVSGAAIGTLVTLALSR